MSLKIDLEVVEKICSRLIAEKDRRDFRRESDPAAMDAICFSDALFLAVVVRLLHTNQSSPCYGIPETWVRNLLPALLVIREHTKAYRVKFIDHAVAPLEDN